MAFYSSKELEHFGFKFLGKNVRVSDKASLYDYDQIVLGDHSRIDDFCIISGQVILGRNVRISAFCNLAGGGKGIIIDDFSGLAYGCQVFSQSDDYSGGTLTNPTIPDLFKKELKAKIHIKRHCIIGTSSVIFPGVTLAEGTAVGAMTMVTKNTKPWSIYFGIPAKKIRDRQKSLLELEQCYLEKHR